MCYFSLLIKRTCIYSFWLTIFQLHFNLCLIHHTFLVLGSNWFSLKTDLLGEEDLFSTSATEWKHIQPKTKVTAIVFLQDNVPTHAKLWLKLICQFNDVNVTFYSVLLNQLNHSHDTRFHITFFFQYFLPIGSVEAR